MKKSKYQISYTLKGPAPAGYRCELFPTKTAANSWLKKNKSKIYWHKLTETNPKSKKPKPLINFEPGDDYIKKVGTLQTHFETGMECMGLVFYEDGIHGPPNPNFDTTKPEGGGNFKFYGNYNAMTFINHGHVIQFPNGEKVGMLKDREFAQKDGYRLSFYPQGFSKAEWITLFASESVNVTIWIKKEKK
jgi:hypothetical protein